MSDAELIDDLNADEPAPIPPQRIVRMTRVSDRFANKVERKLTRINDAIKPDGPPITPEQLAEIGSELRSIQQHMTNISTVTADLMAKLHIPQT